MSRRRFESLGAHVTFSASLLAEPLAAQLSSTLADVAPDWVAGAQVWDGRRRRSPIEFSVRNALLNAVERQHREHLGPRQALAQRLNLGTYEGSLAETLEIRSATNDMTVIVSVDPDVFAAISGTQKWANAVSLQLRRATVAGRPAAQFAVSAIEGLGMLPSAAYGRAGSHDEYAAYNLDMNRGVKAIGLDARRYLPGLYWTNFFGEPYAELIGRSRLLAAPARFVRSVGKGVLVRLSDHPSDWREDWYQRDRAAIIRAMGVEFFFDRDNPDRPTRGLDTEVWSAAD